MTTTELSRMLFSKQTAQQQTKTVVETMGTVNLTTGAQE